MHELLFRVLQIREDRNERVSFVAKKRRESARERAKVGKENEGQADL